MERHNAKSLTWERRMEMKMIISILSSAFVALVIMTFSASAEARPCSECNALSGGAYANCMATCDEDEGEDDNDEAEEAVEQPQDPVITAITKPCPFYQGKLIAKANCPTGCPDYNMSIRGNKCVCPKAMSLSKNGKRCKCPDGKVPKNKKCIEPTAIVDCGTCQEAIKELLGETGFCASKEVWMFSSEELKNDCPPCPDGTISTGWKCISTSEFSGISGEHGFSDPSTLDLWDLILLAIIILVIVIVLKTRRSDNKKIDGILMKRMDGLVQRFNTTVIAPIRSQLEKSAKGLPKSWKETRLGDLENFIIPFLERECETAAAEIATAKSKIDNFGEDTISTEEIDASVIPVGDKNMGRASFAPTQIVDSRDKPTVGLDEVQPFTAETRFRPTLAEYSDDLKRAQRRLKKAEKGLQEHKKEARELGSKSTLTYP